MSYLKGKLAISLVDACHSNSLPQPQAGWEAENMHHPMGIRSLLWHGAHMAVSARSMGSGRVLKSLTDKPSSKFTIASSFTKIKPVMSLLHKVRPPS